MELFALLYLSVFLVFILILVRYIFLIVSEKKFIEDNCFRLGVSENVISVVIYICNPSMEEAEAQVT